MLFMGMKLYIIEIVYSFGNSKKPLVCLRISKNERFGTL